MRNLLFAGSAIVLVGCSPATSDAPPATARTAAEDTPAASDPQVAAAPNAGPSQAPALAQHADDDTPLAWGTRPSREGVLYPIVDGMCIHGRIFPVENGSIYAYGMGLPNTGGMSRGGTATAVALGDRGLAPLAGQGFGKAFGWAVPLAMGGSLPDRLFALLDEGGRMYESTRVISGAVDSPSWRSIFGATPSDSPNNGGNEYMAPPISYGDAGYLFPTRVSTSSYAYSFHVLGRDLTAVRAPKVPGPDLAGVAFGQRIVRIANGEVLGLSSSRNANSTDLKLVRWSPTKPVSDLPLPSGTNRSVVALRVGNARAYIRVDDAVLSYDGTALSPARLSSRPHTSLRDFDVGADDTLVVETEDGTLLRELPTGEIKESKLPAVGSLRGARQGALWLIVGAKPGERTDRLFRELASGAWEEVALPEPPFTNSLRSPLTVEELTVVAKDDVLVNVRRVEKGWGWRTAEPYRAIYRTKIPAEVVRCQDTRDSTSTGVGLYSWPPAAADSCKTPFVVALAELAANPKNDFPNLRATLRGRKELGERVEIVELAARGMSNTGFAVNSVADARVLATDLSKALDVRAEVVCGTPTPTRSRTLDVARGVFVEPRAK